mgnify:CR=1 FL=1
MTQRFNLFMVTFINIYSPFHIGQINFYSIEKLFVNDRQEEFSIFDIRAQHVKTERLIIDSVVDKPRKRNILYDFYLGP